MTPSPKPNSEAVSSQIGSVAAPTAGALGVEGTEASANQRHPWPEKAPKTKRRKSVSSRSFKRQFVASQEPLRKFALRLCGREDMADDLVQETLLKAWNARAQFKPGSNFLSWAFTIMRNTWINHLRRRKKFASDYDERAAENILSAPPSQTTTFNLADLQRAMSELPNDQLEAVLLVGPGDLTYDDAAQILGCAPGTVKSRVSRARSALGDIVEGGRVKMPIDQTEDATEIAETFVAAVKEVEQGGNIEDVLNLEQGSPSSHNRAA
ncbi:sigma-70 family RNA polymerase sigma factor [Erythrobacter sp. SCSIO 43205]|uniref:sigma-70 family RNA polymerase sigma factor n=1 Tax=Erythrobacter sp. SCSIO 43205 TaxID=2779361 RepID=UPI001CA8456F|nr:sigma-70 family RNA polymerase sigma factor [Erythrobacter sp. SCSIO 43205]UAB78911.1 sigma-70 family RNA polymerase sigma factor [Erythrobacter sp. SCSIO 43205]